VNTRTAHLVADEVDLVVNIAKEAVELIGGEAVANLNTANVSRRRFGQSTMGMKFRVTIIIPVHVDSGDLLLDLGLHGAHREVVAAGVSVVRLASFKEQEE
jgi:hypothetical protein